MDEDLVHAIREHKKIPEPEISIRKLLENRNMGMWAESCCDRIVEEVGLDCDHIQIDIFNFPNLTVDHRGFWRCRDVLTGYISEEDFDSLSEVIDDMHDLVRKQNKMLDIIETVKTEEIRKAIKLYEKQYKNLSESDKIFLGYLKEILKSRRLYVSLFRKIKGTTILWYYRLKHWKIYRATYNVLNDMAKENDVKIKKF